MNSWDERGCSWHYRVHQERLDETLFYYLIKVPVFDVPEIRQRLDSLVAQRGLGGIRVFPIFGRYDFLIRAWLHPNIAARFPDWIEASLGKSREMLTFAVTDVIHRWYADQTPDRDRLEGLHDETIQLVQSGRDNRNALEDLIKHHIVITRDRPPTGQETIKFYVAVRTTERLQAIEVALLGDLKEHILSVPDIQYPSIYRGYGFCSILVRGQVDPNKYFQISDLLDWIVRSFRRYEANTETYLLITPYHIAGNETIGTASLDRIRGRDLFVESVLPELYSTYIRSSGMEIVEEFILRQIQPLHPSRAAKRFTHDYLLAYLASRPTDMAKTLFIIFSELESYFRNNQGKFIGLVVGNRISEVYADAGISRQASKFLSLGDSLNLYLAALRVAEDSRYGEIGGDWSKLVEVRNRVMHGAFDTSQWDSTLRSCVEHWPRLRRFIETVEKVTGEEFVGTYWDTGYAASAD